MFSVAEFFAQKKSTAVTCSIAGELPSVKGQPVSLGVAGPVTGVLGNMMLVAGGANFPDSMPWQGGKKKYYKNIYLFKKKGNQIANITGDFILQENIAYPACCNVANGIFYAGGENESGISSKAILLKWDGKTKSIVTESMPGLPEGVTNASAASYSSTVFIAGGESLNGVSDKLWSLDLNNPAQDWKELPSLPKPVSHGLFVAVRSESVLKLYLLGGRKKATLDISELYSSVYEFNTVQNEWRELPSLPYALSAGTGVASGSGGIVLFGGDRGTTFSKVETYLAAISRATNVSEKEELIQQKNQLLAAHPGFSKEILFYDVITGKCKTVGTMPYSAPVTTTAFWWDNKVMIPSGEIKAGVRTPLILMAKLKRRLR